MNKLHDKAVTYAAAAALVAAVFGGALFDEPPPPSKGEIEHLVQQHRAISRPWSTTE